MNREFWRDYWGLICSWRHLRWSPGLHTGIVGVGSFLLIWATFVASIAAAFKLSLWWLFLLLLLPVWITTGYWSFWRYSRSLKENPYCFHCGRRHPEETACPQPGASEKRS